MVGNGPDRRHHARQDVVGVAGPRVRTACCRPTASMPEPLGSLVDGPVTDRDRVTAVKGMGERDLG